MPDSMCAQSSGAYPITVDGGTIAGIVDKDRSLIEYRAIPFAAPPVGELRWRAPQPVVPWDGVRVCDRFAPMCAQPERPARSVFLEYAGEQRTSEDCLYLNVFAPLDRPAEKLPVMVWIHGGAFQVGSSTNATFVRGDLTRHGVILVTVNYRVNAFGFLSHPELTAESEHKASGNYGLMDQIAALAWVRRTIAAFGGDADAVTVFGQSAGGASIANLMASPLANGLFHRAIIQSVAFMPMMPLAQAEQQGVDFMKRAGAASIAELRARPASQIVGLAKATLPLIWPSVDGYVMPESAEASFAAQRQMRMPVLTGWTRDEGTVFPAYEEAGALREALRARFGSRLAEALHHYPAADATQARDSAKRINGDALAGAGVWKAACAHAQGGNPVWLYHFEHEQPFHGGQAYAESDPAAALGVFHSADYPYVFGTLKELTRAWTPADEVVRDVMQRYWVSFARSGHPHVDGLPAWPCFDADGDATMRLGAVPHMDSIPRLDALRFLCAENMIGNFL
ncbi:carboxylesterase family protein [Paraburkholderia sp. Ac-20340]|uniref:carboxylesterase/lipase family protein n=1 Tax=Paraburkholderia sp. Ac-20340 TaxID=2703888 RepID=UPI00197EE514|nr:carboxylesterase family protein [Paraburkholderia sp. Ac-20340]MBN3853522.1 carboxylesterase family protein [Paraburkholderia sp. Ac-20340]